MRKPDFKDRVKVQRSQKHEGRRGQRLFEHEIYSGVLFTDVHFTVPDSQIFFRDTVIECLEQRKQSYL